MTDVDTAQMIANDRTGNIQEWIKAAILLGLGGYLGFNVASGNITNYINERFEWLSYLAIIIFAALGLVVAYGAWRKEATPHDHHHDHNHDHDHHHNHNHDHASITWSIIAIVAIPLLLGIFIPSQPLGVEAVNGNIRLNVATIDTSNSLSKDPLARNILDWLRLFSKTSTPSDYDGTPADLVGFVYREPDMNAGQFMVARFTLSCCVADANAIGIPVMIDNASDFVDGEWVRVQGVFEAGIFLDQRMPILQIAEIDIVNQPEHPYLYS